MKSIEPKSWCVAFGFLSFSAVAACETPFVVEDSDAGPDDAGVGGLGGDGAHPGSGGGSGGTTSPTGGSNGLEELTPCTGEPLRATSVSAGESHACAVQADTGAVFCWGLGDGGQLGTADTSSSSVPLPIFSEEEYAEVVTLGVSTCALRSDGVLACWGNNYDGVLADETDQTRSSPIETASDVVSFTGAAGHVLALTNAPDLLAWGSNQYGQLGLPEDMVGDVPVRTETSTGQDAFVQVDTGITHTCALDADGHAHCAGSNEDGRLGFGGEGTSEFTLVTTERDFSRIEAGFDRTCALDLEGQLVCWGRNEPIFLEGKPTSLPVPTTENGDAVWTDLSLGFDHLCLLDEAGALFCVGDNAAGEIGSAVGSTTTPQVVLPGAHFTRVSAGRDFTCAIDVEGAVICFGANQFGQLGQGATTGDAASESEPPGYVCLPE